MSFKRSATLVAIGFLLITSSMQVLAQQEPEPVPMGFFITSVGLGNGADLGGLAGADAHCQALADAVGAGDRTWRAYLSAQASGGQSAANARDRIGDGPWANAAGLVIATGVDELHYNNAAINYEHALNEKGERVNSGASGGNWTSSGEGTAMLGHHDRFRFTTPGSPWNMAHPSRGCSQEGLVATGGNGLFYCFAAQ